jgi:hypothetical protein
VWRSMKMMAAGLSVYKTLLARSMSRRGALRGRLGGAMAREEDQDGD